MTVEDYVLAASLALNGFLGLRLLVVLSDLEWTRRRLNRSRR